MTTTTPDFSDRAWPDGSFARRLMRTATDRGQLCVGIDPHERLLAEWGLSFDGPGVREFGLRVVEAAADRVGVVKPQVAFFERHGAAGYSALEEVIAAARAAGLLVIADVKRGDIGSTVEAYGAAWLTPGSSLEVDAMTAVAYQGTGSLTPVLELAAESDKGVFVLAATSNPEAIETQRAVRPGPGGITVAHGVTMELEWPSAHGHVGVVIGATVDLQASGWANLDQIGGSMPILAPGFGAQGARVGDIPELFGALAPQVVANVSREILAAGPDGLEAAIDAHLAELRG